MASSRSPSDPRSNDPQGLPFSFSRYEAHPFQPADASEDVCALCGEARQQILHHPTRIRAACLLKGLDPSEVMGE